MDILSIIAVALVAAMLSVLLRQYRPEYAMLTSLAAGIFILALVCTSLVPVVEQVRGILASSSVPGEYAGILFKALGICFVTQIACDTCKDAGETAIGAKVEIAGRITVLVISLPLFTQVLSIVYSLIA